MRLRIRTYIRVPTYIYTPLIIHAPTYAPKLRHTLQHKQAIGFTQIKNKCHGVQIITYSKPTLCPITNFSVTLKAVESTKRYTTTQECCVEKFALLQSTNYANSPFTLPEPQALVLDCYTLQCTLTSYIVNMAKSINCRASRGN